MNAALSLGFEPLLPWAALAAFALPLAALGMWFLWRRKRGAGLRLAAGAALALALANPVVNSEDREALQSVVAVIADRSQSQDLAGRSDETTKALEELKARLARFGQFDVRVAETGGAGDAAKRTSTELFKAARNLLRDVPPSRVAGTILLTDGQVHDVPANASGLSGPLHALITGKPGERDRRIRFEQAPRFGIAGKPAEFSFKVLDEAALGQTVQVSVLVNGERVSNEQAVIGNLSVFNTEVPAAGVNLVEIAVDPVPGEVTEVNNRAVARVEGIRENLRVLLVSGEPHAGERTWRNLLKSDAAVDLIHFTILRPPEKQDGTPINELSLIAFPTRELFVEKIDEFDLIIFDRYQHRDVLPVLYYDYIAQYVEKGGALLIAAGPEYAGEESVAFTPLVPALPAMPTGAVIEETFFPRLTDAGKRHPVTRGLEGSAAEPPHWSRWFRQIGVTAPQGQVVMKGAGDAPLLLLNRHGKGRVGMLLSDQGWLWARGFEGGGPHVALYRRIAHWLMQEPELEEERLTAASDGMAIAVRRQSMAETALPVRIIAPGGKTFDAPLTAAGPGLFTAKAPVDEIGLYRISNGDLATLVHVGPLNAPEFAETVSTETVLGPLAKLTGGSVRRLADTLPSIVPVRDGATAFGRDWIGLRTTSDTVLKSVSRLPLFGGFLGLALLILSLGAMWGREGR